MKKKAFKKELNIKDFIEQLTENINYDYEPYYKECLNNMRIMDYKFKRNMKKRM